jgi:hypothetical protein
VPLSDDFDTLQRKLEERQDAHQAYARWQAAMAQYGVTPTEEMWAAARACGCLSCETCRPDVALVAMELDVPFLNVFILCQRAQHNALARAIELARPKSTRPDRRRLERAALKAGKGEDVLRTAARATAQQQVRFPKATRKKPGTVR